MRHSTPSLSARSSIRRTRALAPSASQDIPLSDHQRDRCRHASRIPEETARSLPVGGVEAESFLQNLITTDIASLRCRRGAAGRAADPAGQDPVRLPHLAGRRWLHHRNGCDHQRDALLKRLTMYKLRARRSTLTPGAEEGVTVSWDEDCRTMGVEPTAALPRPMSPFCRRAGQHGSR